MTSGWAKLSARHVEGAERPVKSLRRGGRGQTHLRQGGVRGGRRRPRQGSTGRLRYVFEYDETGTRVDLYDSPAGKSPPFDDVVRRELARPEPQGSGRDDQGLA